jgi:cytidylate kinase
VQVLLDGQDVSEAIRSPEVSQKASELARLEEVRQVLVDLQKMIGRELGEFVAEGRDQGTVVFPDAPVKFYLDAEPAIRARRRWKELVASGKKVALEDVLKSVMDRDHRDSTRAAGPLAKPPGAVVLDTSGMSEEETVQAMKSALEGRR